MSRRANETYAVPLGQKPLKVNEDCGHIFRRGTDFSRNIFDKIWNGKTQIRGYEIEIKQLWVLLLLLLLFLLSTIGMIAFWFTDTFDNILFSNMALRPNQRSFNMWEKVEPKPLLSVYLFNYTNVREFETGHAEKLNVQERGPYVYEETQEKVNIKVNGSHITYQEHRDYRFMPELSEGRRQNDRINMPNVPLLAAAALNKDALVWQRYTVSGVLKGVNAQPFLSLPAHRIITGYDDHLYALFRSYMELQDKHMKERFGLLANNMGTRYDVITINNGEDDINKVGRIEKVNGESSLHHWSTAECNDLSSATEGSIFSPRLVRNKHPIQVYMKDMCRPLQFNFEKEVKILDGKIPAYRYSLSDSAFDSPDKTPSNQCYCDMDSDCPPQGVFNVSACFFGAPLFTSYPHLYNADPALKKAVTGLNPTPDYQSYVDVHPTMGYTMSLKNRMQVNVRVSKAYGLSQVEMFNDGLFLPIAWFDYSLEDKTLPENIVGVIFLTTFTIRSLEIGVKYGCVLMMAVTLFCIILVVRNRWTKRVRTSSIRPLRTEEEESV